MKLGAVPREFHAGCVLAAGLTSAGTVYLFARGYRNEAIGITIGATILGAFLSAAKLLEGTP